ncbi:hypothetical protein GMST_35860 [Geomonas silvestris]|uniref:SMP-30/Gluconolactonase/LRE-like region domain-containing protein n=1 Tax=Geomonas silvestris TaxID=2740184 RepID=A0A6V8MMK4_9BACT|nr:hypothetical protein GMST_35860 [Geomonas silvestris]
MVLGGNLYVADTNNNQIRVINLATAVVTTLAGISDGYPGALDGDGATARFGGPTGITTDGTYLYVTDQLTNRIRKVTTTGVTTTMSVGYTFNRPLGIATDGTSLFVLDADNRLVRRIDIATEVVSTLAGSGDTGSADNANGLLASFSQIYGVTLAGGQLYITDTQNQTIRQVDSVTGATSTLAGTVGVSGSADGTGTAATFGAPKGITSYGGNLYVAEYFNSTIRKIVISTGVTTTVAGTPGVIGSHD